MFTPSSGPHQGPLSLKPFQSVFILSRGCPRVLLTCLCLTCLWRGGNGRWDSCPSGLRNQHPIHPMWSARQVRAKRDKWLRSPFPFLERPPVLSGGSCPVLWGVRVQSGAHRAKTQDGSWALMSCCFQSGRGVQGSQEPKGVWLLPMGHLREPPSWTLFGGWGHRNGARDSADLSHSHGSVGSATLPTSRESRPEALER